MGGILVFWELWQNHVVDCEECEAEEWEEKIFTNNDS